MTTIAGIGMKKGFIDGKNTVAQFNNPVGIVYFIREDTIFVTDQGNHRIRKITSGIHLFFENLFELVDFVLIFSIQTMK